MGCFTRLSLSRWLDKIVHKTPSPESTTEQPLSNSVPYERQQVLPPWEHQFCPPPNASLVIPTSRHDTPNATPLRTQTPSPGLRLVRTFRSITTPTTKNPPSTTKTTVTTTSTTTPAPSTSPLMTSALAHSILRQYTRPRVRPAIYWRHSRFCGRGALTLWNSDCRICCKPMPLSPRRRTPNEAEVQRHHELVAAAGRFLRDRSEEEEELARKQRLVALRVLEIASHRRSREWKGVVIGRERGEGGWGG